MTTTESLLTHFLHLLKYFSHTKRRKFRNVRCQGKHLTALGQSFSSPLLLCVLIEIDILRHSFDVVKLGNQLKTVWIHFHLSFDSQRLSQIFASLTHENLATREAEVSTLPWMQTEKVIALARCGSGQRAWRNKKPVLTLSALTDEEGHPLENEDESG